MLEFSKHLPWKRPINVKIFCTWYFSEHIHPFNSGQFCGILQRKDQMHAFPISCAQWIWVSCIKTIASLSSLGWFIFFMLLIMNIKSIGSWEILLSWESQSQWQQAGTLYEPVAQLHQIVYLFCCRAKWAYLSQLYLYMFLWILQLLFLLNACDIYPLKIQLHLLWLLKLFF